MRKVLVLLCFLLIACQPAMEETHMDEHLGCMPEEVVDGQCQLVEKDSNAEIFDTLDLSLISSEIVEYSDGFRGYLARPKADGVYPAIVMIHEWWGLNDNIKTMANLLAQEGFVVLAVDLYGEVAETSERAGQLASVARANPDAAVGNMRDAVVFLKSLDYVNADKIGSIGWCFGGAQSLNLALSGEKMSATVIYYGNLVTDKEALSVISWPVLGIFGETDSGIPVASVNEFESSLNELGVENEIKIYEGVGHAFANPSGARYASEETKDAWAKTVDFFNKNLK